MFSTLTNVCSQTPLAFLLISLFAVVLADPFEDADLNHDGVLQKDEFSMFLSSGGGVGGGMANAGSVGAVGSMPLGGLDWSHFQNISFESVSKGTDFVSATLNGLAVILVTELGDKTFFIAAILAMRHSRIVVYAGAMLALGLMHILSCLMGIALPSLLPRKYTHFVSALLFLYFGGVLLKEAYESGEGPSEELQEVEEELIDKKGDNMTADDKDDIERGADKMKPSGSEDNWKVFVQGFTLTFLAEWGDRSQIATIGLAASKNVYGIIVGGLIGHAFCTGLAVVGGRMLAARISAKTVGYVGGCLFLFFAVLQLLFP